MLLRDLRKGSDRFLNQTCALITHQRESRREKKGNLKTLLSFENAKNSAHSSQEFCGFHPVSWCFMNSLPFLFNSYLGQVLFCLFLCEGGDLV